MGHLWSLPLPLLLFCCWGVVATKSSTGPKTSVPGTLVPTNDTEILVVSPGFGTSSEEDTWSQNLMETTSTGHQPLQEPTLTSLQTSVLVSPSQETEAREAETSLVLEDKALTKVTPSKFSGVTASSMETADARSTIPGSDSHEASFHILCTEDISEEMVVLNSPEPTPTKSIVSVNPWGPSSTVRRQPEPVVPTSASGKLTPAVSSGEDAGFLLLRLSVVSQDNLLDPRVAEKLMQQLRCELHAHMLLTEVSLLRVTRS